MFIYTCIRPDPQSPYDANASRYANPNRQSPIPSRQSPKIEDLQTLLTKFRLFLRLVGKFNCEASPNLTVIDFNTYILLNKSPDTSQKVLI